MIPWYFIKQPRYYLCYLFLPHLAPSPFSLFPLHITVSCYTFLTPAVVPLYFPDFCAFSILWTHFWRFGVRSLQWERTFCVSLSGSKMTSLSINFCSYIHLLVNFMILFFFIMEYYSVVCIYHIFISLSINLLKDI